jgi:signal transduction histidine kinase
LVLCREGGLSIEAEASLEARRVVTTMLGSLPVNASPRMAASIVQYALRTKERVILHDAAASPGKFSGDAYLRNLQTSRMRSILAMPILRQAEAIGLLYLENDLLAGAFGPDRLAALELLATQAAISLENALLVARERAARAAAEDAERRAAFLADAGTLLSESLDYEETFIRLGQLCVRSLADWCAIDIAEGHEIHRLAVIHADPAKEPLVRMLQQRYPPRWDSQHAAAVVLRTGEPLLIPELPDESLRARVDNDEHFRICRELGTRTALAVPLVARGQTLGVLSLASGAPGRSYGRADLGLAEEVARRAAIAIDNARLYRARSEFLTVASHELNTPVHSLVLAAQSLRRAVPSGRLLDPQVLDRMLDLVARQGARLARLTNDLLDVSRTEAGGLPLDLEDVELGALVRDVVQRFAADLAQSRCSVTVEGDSPVVGRWDRSRIDRVVTNLLANAIKFGPGKPIDISIGVQGGVARLAVRDHGIGIDPAQLERIFGRFERAVSERHYGGLGLGLYISHTIVEEHGGSIRCESRPGAGATFIVELPCAGPPSSSKGTSSTSS